jgi:glycosyltransferase involved in cell wall biosynthesis
MSQTTLTPVRSVRHHAPRVSVVIPTFNEAANLPHVFAELPDWLYEIIVVDGHSTDGTADVARALRPDAVVVQQTRRGKGNALACGFATATGDIIVMLDADGSADPGEIERYVAALVDGADFAKGTRFANGGGSSDITRLRRVGNRLLNGLVNAIYGTRYSDLCYGYNAFWSYCLPHFALEPGETADEMRWGDGFEIETVLNTRVARANLVVTEVPSFERDRIHGVSNLNAVSDGLRVLRAIAEERRRASLHDVPRSTRAARAVSPEVINLNTPLVIDLVGPRVEVAS